MTQGSDHTTRAMEADSAREDLLVGGVRRIAGKDGEAGKRTVQVHKMNKARTASFKFNGEFTRVIRIYRNLVEIAFF